MTPRARRGRGQAAVEFALVLPLVAVVLLGVVQLGLVVRDQILVVHAAREAARQAAVDPSTDAARRAAVEGSGLRSTRIEVDVTGRGGPGSRVYVRVRYRAPTDVPVVGGLVGDVSLEATTAMRVER